MALQLSGITISGGIRILFDSPPATITASYLAVACGSSNMTGAGGSV